MSSDDKTVENDLLALDFENALKEALSKADIRHGGCEVVNFANLNLDITVLISNAPFGRFFNYWGIGHIRRKIKEGSTLQDLAQRIVNGIIFNYGKEQS